MSFLTQSSRCALVAFAATQSAFLVLAVPALAASKASKGTAAAQSQQGAPAAQAEAGKRAYEGGVKAYSAGRYQNAVDQFNVALGGGLGTQEMARGLYYRGLAYKRLNQPGLAISDLTSALWLKNGLNDAERQSATAERAEVYKSAGVASAPATHVASEPVPSVPAAAAAPAPQAQLAPAAVAAGPVLSAASTQAHDGGIPQPLSLGGESATIAAPRYNARAPDSGPIDQQSALEQTTVASMMPSTTKLVNPRPQPILSAAPMEQSATAQPSNSLTSGGSSIGGFFSNIFGGNTSPTQAPAAMSTASTGPVAAAPVAPLAPNWDAAATSGAGGTASGKAKSAKADKKGKVQAAADAVPASTKGGKYKIHIAAVRSRAEADALAQRLNSEHGRDFANRTASVDEAVIGTMGTFYRVRVGSYANAEEPRGLCNSLRNSGYDCLVVSN